MSSRAAALDNFDWKPGLTGAQDWQVDGNWVQPGFPNSGAIGATVAVGSDLTLNVGDTDVALAALTLDATNAATDVNLVSSVGRLVLQNDDNNVGVDPAPGNPDVEDILSYEGVNRGRVFVTSNGVAGSTNTISAPVRLANNGFLEGVDFLGSNSITLSGPIDVAGAADTDAGSLRSYLPDGAKLHVTGPINLTDAIDNSTARFLLLNNYFTTDHAEPPRGTIQLDGPISGSGGLVVGWTWDVDGDIGVSDDWLYDPAPSPGLPLGTVILSGNNTFTGDVVFARGNLVVRNDHALGDASDAVFRQGGQSGKKKEVGYNLVIDTGDRKIANTMAIVENLTIKGNSSLEWSGTVYQDNGRTLINLLPYDFPSESGSSLTFSGAVYPNRKAENPPGSGRELILDGTGRTVISGGIHDQLVTGDEDPTILDKVGYVRVRGTGSVVIDGRVFDGMGVQTGFNDTDYTGLTFVDGSNLHFRGGQNDAFTGDDLPSGAIVSRSGAVGVDEGVRTNSSFLAKLNNSNNPNWDPNTTPFFATWGDTAPVYTGYATGGLMLGTAGGNEYTQDLDFTSGDLANAANMSLAAQEGGSTYSGTITPSSTIKVNPDTYQLGGGSGVLTLPNANQLTGARNLLVTNGGEVKLTATNNYTGVTRVMRKYQQSLQELAAADTGDPDNDVNYDETNIQLPIESTLAVAHLANGGVASSIGSSSNASSNLVIQGSTLKYEGAATSTDRLFTVGTSGATLDASGSGAVSFTNPGALAIAVPARRSGLIATVVPGDNDNTVFGQPAHPTASRQVFQTDDLALGMRVYTPQLDFTPPEGGSPVRITAIQNREVMQAGQPNPLDSEADYDGGTLPNQWPGYTATAVRTIQFGPAPARFLTLTGANTGNNTLAPLIGDAPPADIDAAATTPEVAAAEAAAGYGTVGIRKQGTGKWVLTGNNTYTGATNVEAGTLLINGNQTGAGLTTVSSGAAFGGTGQIGGSLVMEEGATFATAFAAGTIDPLNVLGDVDLSALGNILSVAGSGVGSSWTLLTYVGTLTGTFESTPGYTVDYGTGTNSQITIMASAGLIGDYNNDHVVNAADYTVWRDNLGLAGSALGAESRPSQRQRRGERGRLRFLEGPFRTDQRRRQPRRRVRPRARQLPVSRPRPVRSCLEPAAGKLKTSDASANSSPAASPRCSSRD